MHTEGLFAPETIEAAREQYAATDAAADAVLRALARAVPLAEDAGDVHADDDLRLTAREAIFASLLAVHVGTREEFDDWIDDRDRAVEEVGSEQVSNVVWHDAGAADRILAATFENEPEAAVGTLRRQAFATLYRERL
jgi:hypothetical protein